MISFFLLIYCGLSNYADEITLYSSGNNMEQLQHHEIETECFYEYYMLLNSGKCHFMSLRQYAVNETFVYNNTKIKIIRKRKYYK